MDFTNKWRAGNTVYLRCGSAFVLCESCTIAAEHLLTNKYLVWQKDGTLQNGEEGPLDIINIKSAREAGARERMREIMWGSDRENEA